LCAARAGVVAPEHRSGSVAHVDVVIALRLPAGGRPVALLAEIGVDMERFPTPGHLASLAKVCPGTHQSGDQRCGASIGKGNNCLQTTLIEAAWAASRTKRSYYSAQFRRLRARRGPKKAVVAVAHSMLHAYWHILHDCTEHRDLGPAHLDDIRRDHLRRHHLKRLKDLGLNVTIEEAA